MFLIEKNLTLPQFRVAIGELSKYGTTVFKDIVPFDIFSQLSHEMRKEGIKPKSRKYGIDSVLMHKMSTRSTEYGTTRHLALSVQSYVNDLFSWYLSILRGTFDDWKIEDVMAYKIRVQPGTSKLTIHKPDFGQMHGIAVIHGTGELASGDDGGKGRKCETFQITPGDFVLLQSFPGHKKNPTPTLRNTSERSHVILTFSGPLISKPE